MCYFMHFGTKSAKSYAEKRSKERARLNKVEEKLNMIGDAYTNNYCVNAFAHPELLVFTSANPYEPETMRWGLIPHWTKDEHQAVLIQNQTLNARFESIFEKPAFRHAAKTQRCLIYADGFYEFHHIAKQTFPHYIHASNNEPIIIAGLYGNWINEITGEMIKTATLVTTVGNEMMRKIHNNPKVDGPRMPLILNEQTQDIWLDLKKEKDDIDFLSQPVENTFLTAYTVSKINGNNSLGNVVDAIKPYHYPQLDQKLF
jgi:putative SOS response-associated peptidase YedK